MQPTEASLAPAAHGAYPRRFDLYDRGDGRSRPGNRDRAVVCTTRLSAPARRDEPPDESHRADRLLPDSESRPETAGGGRGVRDLLTGVHRAVGWAHWAALAGWRARRTTAARKLSSTDTA